MRRTLDGEDSRGDASADAFACVLGFLQTGHDIGDIIDHAFTQARPGLRHYRSFAAARGRLAAVRKIGHEVRRARSYIRDHPAVADANNTQHTLIQIADVADDHPSWFRGKAGTTDHIVLMNLIDIGRNVGSMRFTASCRQVAEACAITSTTAARSLERLATSGRFLKVVRESSGRAPKTYELRLPRLASGDGWDDGEYIRRSSRELAQIDDVFASANLGPGPGRTHALLLPDQPISLADLMRRTARSRSTVSAHVRLLVERGLAQRIAGGVIAVKRQLSNVIPVRRLRRTLHEAQRQVFHHWLQTGADARWRAAKARSGSSDSRARVESRN